jgi:cytochrome c
MTSPGPNVASRRQGRFRREWLALVAVTVVFTTGVPRASADQSPVPDAFEACASCHSYERGEPAQEGPPLWGVVGRQVASVDGFGYSPALKALGGSWDRARLDQFLKDPKAMAPGTLMNLGRVSNANERAAVLDFLETLAADEPAAAARE